MSKPKTLTVVDDAGKPLALEPSERPAPPLSQEERDRLLSGAPAAPPPLPEPAASRWPEKPEDWRTRHSMLVVAGIERWWDRVPPGKRALVRQAVIELVSQMDIEEASRG